MSEKEIKERDKIIRSYLLGRTWDNNDEFKLVRNVISLEYPDKQLCENLQLYPYLFDYEWEVVAGLSNLGKGDLIFTDNKNNFLILECKYLDSLPLYGSSRTARTKRTQKRKDVKVQVTKYMKAFSELYKWESGKNSIKGISITNEGWDLFIFEDEKDKGPILNDNQNIHFVSRENVDYDNSLEVNLSKTLGDEIETLQKTLAIDALNINKITFERSDYLDTIEKRKDPPKDETILQYATKKWDKEPLNVIFALSAWLKDVKVSHWIAEIDIGKLILLNLNFDDKNFFEIGFAESNNQANKQASKKFKEPLFEWLQKTENSKNI